MSLWRKRQITDYEKCEMENIKRRAKELHANILHRQRTNEILISIFDILLLCSGFALCAYSFGLSAGLGLGVLALFARGE